MEAPCRAPLGPLRAIGVLVVARESEVWAAAVIFTPYPAPPWLYGGKNTGERRGAKPFLSFFLARVQCARILGTVISRRRWIWQKSEWPRLMSRTPTSEGALDGCRGGCGLWGGCWCWRPSDGPRVRVRPPPRRAAGRSRAKLRHARCSIARSRCASASPPDPPASEASAADQSSLWRQSLPARG